MTVPQQGEFDMTGEIEKELTSPAPGGGETPPAGGAPAGGAAPAPKPGETPPAPDDPEFELEPGKKHKRSEIIAWRETHGLKDKLEKDSKQVESLIALDQHLAKNPNLAQLILSVIRNEDESLLTKARVLFGLDKDQGAGTEGKPPAGADLLKALEAQLDLDDPSIKALHQLAKDLHTRLTKYEGRIATEDEARETADAEKHWQGELDRVWKASQFDKLLEGVPEEDRAEVAKDIRNRILFAVSASEGKVSMDEVAKRIHERTAKLVQGIIKGYTAKKDGAPPMGGKGGQDITTPAEPPKLGEETEKAIVQELEQTMAGRE